MKKIIFLFGLMATLAFLASCEDSTLPVPTNVRIEDETTLVWDAVTGAEAYILEAGSQRIEGIKTTSQDLTVLHDVLADGTYEIRVAATLGDLVSEFSDAVTYIIDTTISTVTNLSIDASMLTWDAVADATSYRVTVLGQTFSVTTNAFDLTQLSDMPMEMIQVSVVAMIGTDMSMPVTITYDYTMAGMEPMLFMLKMVNPSYDMDMDESDFDTDDDYQEYVMTIGMIESYMSYSNTQSPKNAAMMFGMAQSLQSEDVAMDPFSLFNVFDDAESMDGQVIADLLISYVLSMTEMNQAYNEMYLELFNEQLNVLDAEYQAFTTEGVMSDMRAAFDAYMNATDFDRLFTTLEIPLYDLDYKFSVIYETWQLLDSGMTLPIYYETDVELIQQAVRDAFNANDAAMRALLEDDNTYYDLMEYGNMMWNYRYTLDEIEYFTGGQTDPVMALIESDREALEMSLAVLFDYILDVRTAIETPLNNIQSMLNNGTATNAQIVNVKDQVIYAVYENLPESELLIEAFSVIFMIAYGQMDIDPGNAQADAEIVVPQFLLTMEAFAEFMYMIDEDDIDTLMTHLESLTMNEDIIGAIDLLVWGAGHILAFEEAFPTLVDALDANQLFFLDISLIADALGMMIEIQDLETLLTDLFAVQQPLIRDYMEVFVNTEGALFKDLVELSMTGSSLDKVIDALLPYVYATTTNLLTEDAESLVADVLELLAPELGMALGLSEADAFSLVASITGDVNDVLTAFLSVGEVLVESAANVSLDDAIMSEETFFLAVLNIVSTMFADNTFTNSYDLVFEALESILTKPQVLDITMITVDDVTMMLNDADIMLTELIDMITYVAAIDLDNMSEEDEQMLLSVFAMFSGLFGQEEEPFPGPVDVEMSYDALNNTVNITNNGFDSYVIDMFVYDIDFNIIEMTFSVSLPSSSTISLILSSTASDYLFIDIYDQNGNYLDYISLYLNE